jgi:hypothetical protein
MRTDVQQGRPRKTLGREKFKFFLFKEFQIGSKALIVPAKIPQDFGLGFLVLLQITSDIGLGLLGI